jgi:hypothetical protein
MAPISRGGSLALGRNFGSSTSPSSGSAARVYSSRGQYVCIYDSKDNKIKSIPARGREQRCYRSHHDLRRYRVRFSQLSIRFLASARASFRAPLKCAPRSDSPRRCPEMRSTEPTRPGLGQPGQDPTALQGTSQKDAVTCPKAATMPILARQNDREPIEPPYPRAILLNVLACVPLRE